MNRVIRNRESEISVPTLLKDDGLFTSNDEQTAECLLNKWFPDDDVLSDNNELSYMRHLVELYLSKNIVETVPQITADELKAKRYKSNAII